MKVFCVGLSNTGTTSLTVALRTLGFDAVHWHVTRHALRYGGSGIDINWPLLERHDAFADTPMARIFRELDAGYSDARFILSVRDPRRWLSSFEARFGIGGLDGFSARLHRDLYGTDRCDRERCIAAFEAHTAAVRAHFADRPQRLLEIDIDAGDAWQPLCAFLSLPVPAQRFPRHLDRAELDEGLGYRIARMPGQLIRRLRAATS
ncbi:MAG: hypothetical protein K9M02_02205 [Thiohalocapsa sp.]|nr:hypothetical protein [Thiohalocapsa sp.]